MVIFIATGELNIKVIMVTTKKKTLSLKKYPDEINPYLIDIINNLTKFDT